MKLAYRISEKVYEDLESIWIYTFNNWSLEQADTYFELIIAAIENISLHFDKGKNMSHIKDGYRRTRIKSHLIFYKKAKDGVVEIVRIFHQNMDVENRL